jgi:hypothetical protein
LGEIVTGRFYGPEADRVTVRDLAEDYLNDYRINGKKTLDKAGPDDRALGRRRQ